MGILLRWLAAYILLAATFNPTPWNYIRWAEAHYSDQLSMVVFLGLLLSVGYIIALNATLNSIGLFGMIMIGAIFAALVWVLHDWGMLHLDQADDRLWLGLLALSVILAIGLSWSHMLYHLTGQGTVDDPDE